MDWRVYADATCAGLSTLIPLPGVDMVTEAVFRQRMPTAIARARGVDLASGAVKLFGRGRGDFLSLESCLVVPFFLAKRILRRIWRKIIYIFTIKDAADQLSLYWHRAFLLDHIIRAGHAGPGADIDRTFDVFEAVLDEADTSGARSLARQMVVGAHHATAVVRRARRGGAEETTPDQRDFLKAHWDVLYGSLSRVAAAYNEAYSAWEIKPDGPEGNLGLL